MSDMTHLDELEAEAIYIMREVVAECEKPVMLYSIGKDSSVMLHLALKAFYPEKPPFPFLHVNTTWKFKEMIEFRDKMAKKLGIDLIVYTNEDGVKKGINPFDHGSAYTDIMKTQALKGMRDLLPAEQTLRDYIQGKILETYRASGFERISTPMLEDMENLDKSDGGDNLNLIFKVMKRGDKLTSALGSGDPKQLSDMGLRYDLTLPLSRFYAANKDKLPHPFKVIQTDRVFRAERPQKGRLREFVQCDIDILGDESPNAEVELIDVTTRALLNIGFTGFTVNINDRRILRGMLESMGFAADTLDSVCITFDKMDKIGAEGVKAELTEKQLPEAAINALADFIAAGDVTLESVASRCADPAIADDLKYVLATAKAMANGRFDVAYCPSLVRGQGYYTGMVFEITCPQFSGAVAGGGRYDNMIGKFLGTKVPAVGFSIGFERVCGILLEQGYQIPGAKQKIALLYNSDVDFPAVLAKAAQLRDTYNVTVLPQAKKLGKQLGQLEASGFAGAAFMDKDEVKIF